MGAVVLIEIRRVSGVVDAVVRGRIEDELEGAELSDGLGVNPELVKRADRDRRRET
jgi:hypothetical protein